MEFCSLKIDTQQLWRIGMNAAKSWDRERLEGMLKYVTGIVERLKTFWQKKIFDRLPKNVKRVRFPEPVCILFTLAAEAMMLVLALIKGNFASWLHWMSMFNLALLLFFWAPRQIPRYENSPWKIFSLAGIFTIACQFCISLILASFIFSEARDAFSFNLKKDMVWIFWSMFPVSCLCMFYLWPRRKAPSDCAVFLNGRAYFPDEEYCEYPFLENEKEYIRTRNWSHYALIMDESFSGKKIKWKIVPLMEIEFKNKTFNLEEFYTKVKDKLEAYIEEMISRTKGSPDLENMLLAPDLRFEVFGNTVSWTASRIKKRLQ